MNDLVALLITVIGFVSLAIWLDHLLDGGEHPRPWLYADSYDDVTALADAAGVLRTRDEPHAETLAYAEAQRDLTDERIAAWLEDAR